jgi:hypothetical protein
VKCGTERGSDGELVKLLTSDGEGQELPDFGAHRMMEMEVGGSARSKRWKPGKLGLQLGGTGGKREEAELRELLTAGGDGRRRPENGGRRSSGGLLGFRCGRRSSGPPVRGRGVSASVRCGRARGGVVLLRETTNRRTAGGGSVLQRAALHRGDAGRRSWLRHAAIQGGGGV